MMKPFDSHPFFPYWRRLTQRGRDFLGSEFSIMCGAMTWVSDHSLVAGVCNAGGFGVLAAGALSVEELEQEIYKTKEKTSRSFGVNVILMHSQFQELLEVCARCQVSHVILGAGIPSEKVFRFLNDHGIIPMAFAPTVAVGRRLIRLGAKGLIIEGNEAGGHVGPVSTQVLAQEILPQLSKEVPVFVAGGVSTGQGILSYLLLGACGCQLGSRFVCSYESQAHPAFKQAFIRASARDAILTPQLDPRLPVIPVRALFNKATEEFIAFQKEILAKLDAGILEVKEAGLCIEHFWAGSLRRAVQDGDIERGSLMAGQSVGMIKKEESCQDIIQQLVQEALDSGLFLMEHLDSFQAPAALGLVA